MPSAFRRVTALWLRFTEPLLLNREGHEATSKALRSARIAMFPEWYLGLSHLVSGVAGAVVAALAYIALRYFAVYETALPLYATAFGSGMFVYFGTRMVYLSYPRLRAQGRARRIDEELPSVITLCYALARGGMNPLECFRAVSAEKETYGEAAVELKVILRNVEWFGQDIITSLKDASSTTPSRNMRAFLDGLVTVLNSGSDPTDYFRNQAESQLAEAELNLERDQEQASLLAEMYVSGLLVLPLLLLIVLSGLAPIAPGQDTLIPFVVFGLIPLGTAVYIIVLETLLPPEALKVPFTPMPPLADFGADTAAPKTPLLPPPWKTSGGGANATRAMSAAEAANARSLRWRILVARVRQRGAAAWHRFMARMLARPVDALEFSGFFGLAIAGGVGFVAWSGGVRGVDLGFALTGILVLALAVTAIPVSIFHEMRVRRANRIEKAIPPMLSKLAGFNERGISLLQSFQILGSSSSGPLANELKAVDRDVTWNGSVAGALRRLRARVNTLRMTKLTILLERASAATANLREVLHIAAEDATRTEHLRTAKRQAMMSYVVVVYIVFAVFLYVLYVVANLFYGPEGLGAAAAKAGGGLSAGLNPHDAKILFAQAAVLQGVGCGLVAGRLGEGHLLSGLKHAVFLGTLALFVFYVGVL